MKKKMLFICAAGLLTAGIASAIESANIVGYQKVEGTTGGNRMFVTSPFVSVLSPDQKFTLTQITGNLRNYDTVQFLNAAGNVASSAYYWASDRSWWDVVSGNEVTDVEYLAGVGMIVSTATKFDGFIAGQVEEDDITIPLNSGKTLVGNASPVTLELGQFTFSGLANYHTVDFLNAAGNVYASAYYWASSRTWWDVASGDEATDWEILPGEGFLVNCLGGSVKIPTAMP